VYEDDKDTKTTENESYTKHRWFGHRLCRPAAAVAAPQTIATILAPTAAVVPAPTTSLVAAPLTTQASCANPNNFASADESAMRLAHEMEMNLSNLSAARAAQKARMDAYDATIQRVTNNAAQMSLTARAATMAPQGDSKPPTLEDLAKNLQSLTERVEKLQAVVQSHTAILQKQFPNEFKDGQK
jgi:hypothetical protein